MSFECLSVGKGLDGDEGSWLFGILIPVVSDASRFFSGLFYEFLDLRSCDFNGFGFDSHDSDNFDVGHKRYVLRL